jgi:hypothetical protein
MRGRVFVSAATLAGLLGVLMFSSLPLAGQTAKPAAPTAKPAAPARKYVAPRTENGHPDLNGVWAYGTATPLERPNGLATKAEFTDDDEEAFAAAAKAAASRNQDDRSGGAAADVSRAYNDFWWDRGKTLAGRQTSLVIDPADGRIPAILPEATKRNQARAALRPQRTPGIDADNPEDRSLWERCVTRAMPTLPGPYNNNLQIVQSKDHVVIVQEMIHEARIIPTDGRPHGKIRRWHGDSVGKWEGDTLVVDTINFTDKTNFRGSSENLHLVERYTRVAPDTVLYQVTASDPTTWAKPFTIQIPMAKNEEGFFEYACHEGNKGLEGILKGSRLLEKELPARRPAAATPATATPPAAR